MMYVSDDCVNNPADLSLFYGNSGVMYVSDDCVHNQLICLCRFQDVTLI